MNSKTPPATAASPPDIQHVLVVDSQEMIRSIVCHLLQSWGFTTCAATNLACACRKVVADGPYDAIICNYDLPDGTAFDLVDWMHAQQLEVPTVVPYGALEPMSAAPDNVKLMPKPFDPLELREAIEHAAHKDASRISRSRARQRSLRPHLHHD